MRQTGTSALRKEKEVALDSIIQGTLWIGAKGSFLTLGTRGLELTRIAVQEAPLHTQWALNWAIKMTIGSQDPALTSL